MCKICVNCKIEKSYSEFNKNSSKPDGLQNICKSCKKTYQKVYYKQYNKLNRNKRNRYFSEKIKSDINFKLAHNLRSRLRSALKRQNTSKNTKTIKLLGCSIQEFKIYIESKFKKGMTWNNYGKDWHIDHIFPISHFILRDEKEIMKACHYTNLQPLWAEENLSKNNRV